MKKIIAFSALALVLSGCSLLKQAQNAAQSVTGGAKSYSVKGLKAAIALGIPLKCSYQLGDAKVQGYVKGKKWRGKMKSQQQVGDVIIKDNCMWTWGGQPVQGVTMCFEPDEEGKSIWDQDEASAPDIDYTCAPAAVSDDMFQPPADVKFTDMSQMMQGFSNGNNSESGNSQIDEADLRQQMEQIQQQYGQ